MGQWKNYDDLEDSLTLEELTSIANSIRKKEGREREFFAAINGIDTSGPDDREDVLTLSGNAARQAGFGIGAGLGYEKLGGDS